MRGSGGPEDELNEFGPYNERERWFKVIWTARKGEKDRKKEKEGRLVYITTDGLR